jgi:pimeloyl-ACP methyl ester carboxylesterase
VQRLASTGVRVLAPALPGFSGTAALPAGEDSLRNYAAWVLAFLDAVAVAEPVLLVGHSFGGAVAILVAHDKPHRLGGLVLVNSVGGAAWIRDGARVRPMAERPFWDWGVHLARDFRTPRHVTRVLPVVLSEVVPNLLTGSPRVGAFRTPGLSGRPHGGTCRAEAARPTRRGGVGPR